MPPKSKKSMPACPACGERALRTAAERHRNLCDSCATDTGVWARPPALRPIAPCRRCTHTRFVVSQLRERSSTGGEYGSEYMAPMGVSFATRSAGIFKGRKRAEPKSPIGLLFAYICQRCGYTELYTAGAANLPIGPEYGTEVFDVAPEGRGPFR